MTEAPRAILEPAALAQVVRRLGGEISDDHPEGVVVVGVLKGGVCLVADLLRAVTVPCVVDFLALSPYAGEQTRVRVLKDVNVDVRGLDVVLVEDVVDTGLSAHYVVGLLEARGARRVHVCTLLDRPTHRIVPVPLAYVGLEAPDEFLVGYGLDAAERYRNLPGIHAVDPARLQGDRQALERELYGATAPYRTGSSGR
ncbi:MAG: hypoxanthine phosphoribosyltransferase [Acidimicrobiaceae bacterium]|nr:hypoxanthine phosphoribosyltransferase [Acidimicrobiaceae bacterium]